MLEKIRKGEPVSIIDFQEFSEDPIWAYQANQAKKEFNRNRPKTYRNGTGKRFSKTKDKLKLVEGVYIVETDEQALYEEQNELQSQ